MILFCVTSVIHQTVSRYSCLSNDFNVVIYKKHMKHTLENVEIFKLQQIGISGFLN